MTDLRTAVTRLLNEIHDLRLEGNNSSLRGAADAVRDALAQFIPPTDDARPPDGYAYRYSYCGGSVIRFNGGEEINGGKPVEVIPYWLGRPSDVDTRHQAALSQEIWDLISESEGVAGLHLNGDIAPWDELLPGGRFERLTSLTEAPIALSAETIKPPRSKSELAAPHVNGGVPTIDDIYTLCEDHEFHLDGQSEEASADCLLNIVTDALARWGRPAQPQPLPNNTTEVP